MNKYRVSPELKKCASEYVQNGVLSKSEIVNIINAEDDDVIINAIRSYYTICEDDKSKIWMYVISRVWKTNDIDTVFNEQENVFFKILLEKKGILKRTDCLKHKILGTDFKNRKTAENLNDMKLIDIITVSRDVIYILNLNFYKEVLKDAKPTEKKE